MLSNLFRDPRAQWFPFLAALASDTGNLAGRLFAMVRFEKAMSPARERPAAGRTSPAMRAWAQRSLTLISADHRFQIAPKPRIRLNLTLSK